MEGEGEGELGSEGELSSSESCLRRSNEDDRGKVAVFWLRCGLLGRLRVRVAVLFLAAT